MTYGRGHLASHATQDLDGATVSHLAELVRGESSNALAKAPSSAPSGHLLPKGRRDARGPRRRTHERDRADSPVGHPIGAYVPMVDGPEKVSGRAKYTADVLQPEMLAGRIYRSPYAHAEILEVDISEAAKLPGVLAIVTGADCDKTFGVLPIARSEHPLGARQGALQGRAGGGGGGHRRGHGGQGDPPHQE